MTNFMDPAGIFPLFETSVSLNKTKNPTMNTPPETLKFDLSAPNSGLHDNHSSPPGFESKNLHDHATALELADMDPEEEELAQHEGIIADSLKSAFVRAGTALQTIQDKKLYKRHFDSFDAHVQARWGWHRAHAYRLIEAAQTMGELSPIGDTALRLPMPTSESQLRPLSGLDADKQRMVWMQAVEDAGGRTPTADIVKAAVVVVLGPRKNSASKAAKLDLDHRPGPSDTGHQVPATGRRAGPAAPEPILVVNPAQPADENRPMVGETPLTIIVDTGQAEGGHSSTTAIPSIDADVDAMSAPVPDCAPEDPMPEDLGVSLSLP